MQNKILNDFLAQSNIDDSAADERKRAEDSFSIDAYNMALEMKLEMQRTSIASIINAPTNINNDMSIDRTKSHHQFENYDHSLEMDRVESLGIKRGLPHYDEYEMRPIVDENGKISYESNLTIDDLLEKT